MLIGVLKENYLPLREIRKQLAGLSDLEISGLLAESPTDARGAPATAIRESQDDAASYIRRVMEESLDNAETRPGRSLGRQEDDTLDMQSPTRSFSPIRRFGDLEPRDHRQTHNEAGEPGTRWRRIELGPGAELHIREDAFERNKGRVDWLIDWASRVFR